MGYTNGSATSVFSNIYKVDNLPPMHVPKKVKEGKKWQRAVLDAFEAEGVRQFKDNLQFIDLYRMVEGKLSYQELSEVAPHMSDLQSLLDGVGIPSFLRHYDIIGIIVNALVGYYSSMQPKFHVTDTGEVAENDFLRFRNEKLQELMKNIIKNRVDMHMAQNGLTPEGKRFESKEEQIAFMQQLEQQKQRFVPQDTERDSKKSFKTVGIQWGEATLERDSERFNFMRMERRELKDQLITGRCFRHYRIGYDDYEPETWSAKNTFFSRELDADMVHKGQYVGRLDFMTPSQVIQRWHHLIDTKTQQKLLGGNKAWKSFTSNGVVSGSIEDAVRSNFNKQARVPFSNYFDYNFYLDLQDETNIPMGIQTLYKEDGSTERRERYLPRLMGDSHGRYEFFSRLMRDDYRQREDLCQVTEVYFRAYELLGYLTFEDESGMIRTEKVTEDILKDFLKENNIKQTYTESLVDVVDSFEPNTLKWVYVPVIYEGAKVQSQNLSDHLYLYCKKSEHQIKGDSEFDRWLPVAGFIGKSSAKKIEPYQAKYNLCMNQIYSLLEKEIGIFFMLDTAMIPSEYKGWGDAEEALIALRNVAKDTGILPVATGPDSQRNPSNFNQFTTYNLNYSTQINDRVRLAEFSQRKAYEVIGMNPNILSAPTKYETAEGIKQNQEATYAQISEIYEDFEEYIKASYELHLSVAQYCQSNNKDISLYYTKSDASISFLKISDPQFPLRRIGLIASADNKKRKDLETFRTYLLQTNTLGADTLELAKLISSDAMSEAVEIAQIARERKAEEDRVAFERQKELVDKKNEGLRQVEEEKFLREEQSKERDRETAIEREKIKALGRAADKDSDREGFTEINKAAEIALKANSLEQKQRKDEMDFKRAEKKDMEEKQLRMQELKLKAEELQQRVLDRKSKEYIATINKN